MSTIGEIEGDNGKKQSMQHHGNDASVLTPSLEDIIESFIGNQTDLVVSPTRVAAVQKRLIEWYLKHRRKLPWRGDDPKLKITAYGTWVSEVMLQQTRVETVVDYYYRWMERFPNVVALACASEEEVNTLWAGLGYYRRAQQLLKGAKQLVNNSSNEDMEDNNLIPKTVPELLKVPSIGPYTAGAISSIAFNQSVPLVDGNVMRVFSRLFALKHPVGSTIMDKLCWSVAGQLVDPNHPGDFNQALMELGATVCTPSSPQCGDCPLHNLCATRTLVTARSNSSRDDNEIKNKGSIKKFLNTEELDNHASEPAQLSDIEDLNISIDLVLKRIKDDVLQSSMNRDYIMTLLPCSVTDLPNKVQKKKPKEISLAVTVLRAWTSTATADENNYDGNETKFFFVKRPETGLLANQWEFPNQVTSSDPMNNNNSSMTDDEEQLERLFEQFPNEFSTLTSLPFRNDTIISSASSYGVTQYNSQRLLSPIIHVFSHERHTMHILVRDVFVSAETYQDNEDNNRRWRWMTAAEITSMGITTGCKKILQQVMNIPHSSDLTTTTKETKRNVVKKRSSTDAFQSMMTAQAAVSKVTVKDKKRKNAHSRVKAADDSLPQNKKSKATKKS